MPVTLPKVAAPLYKSDIGDPIVSYSAAATPRPPTSAAGAGTPRRAAPNTNNKAAPPAVAPRAAHPQGTRNNKKGDADRESAWVRQLHVSPVFSAYPRERMLLLNTALQEAAAARQSAATPRTALTLAHVPFCVGDGADGCITATAAQAGSVVASLPGITPHASQFHDTAASNRKTSSPRRAADTSPPTTPRSRNHTAGDGKKKPSAAPMLFEMSVADSDAYFMMIAAPTIPKAADGPQKSGGTAEEESAPPQPAAPQLVWTVIRRPVEKSKSSEADQQQASDGTQEGPSGKKATDADHSGKEQKEGEAATAADDPDVEGTNNATKASPAPRDVNAGDTLRPEGRDGQPIRIRIATHVTTDSDTANEDRETTALSQITVERDETAGQNAFRVRAERGDDADHTYVSIATTDTNMLEVSGDRERSGTWRFALADGASSGDVFRVLSDTNGGEKWWCLSSDGTVTLGNGNPLLMRLVNPPPGAAAAPNEEAATAGQQQPEAAPNSKAKPATAAAEKPTNKKQPKAKKAARQPKYRYHVELHPIGAVPAAATEDEAQAPEPKREPTHEDGTAAEKPQDTDEAAAIAATPSQLWGLHAMTAPSADGSRQYFFTCKAYPKYYLTVAAVHGNEQKQAQEEEQQPTQQPGVVPPPPLRAMELVRRPAGDEGIHGVVLVRSRQAVVDASRHDPPKVSRPQPPPPPPPRTELRRGDVLAAGEHLESPSGEFWLSVLRTGNLLIETAVDGRARLRAIRQRMKQGPTGDGTSPPQSRAGQRSGSPQQRQPGSRGGAAVRQEHRQQQHRTPAAVSSSRGASPTKPATSRGQRQPPPPSRQPTNAGSATSRGQRQHQPAAAPIDATTSEETSPSLWQTGTVVARPEEEVCGGLRLGGDGRLMLLAEDADLADPLWQSPAHVTGSLLRLSDTGALELLEFDKKMRHQQTTKQQRRQRQSADDASEYESEPNDSDDDDGGGTKGAMVVVWSIRGDDDSAPQEEKPADASESPQTSDAVPAAVQADCSLAPSGGCFLRSTNGAYEVAVTGDGRLAVLSNAVDSSNTRHAAWRSPPASDSDGATIDLPATRLVVSQSSFALVVKTADATAAERTLWCVTPAKAITSARVTDDGYLELVHEEPSAPTSDGDEASTVVVVWSSGAASGGAASAPTQPAAEASDKLVKSRRSSQGDATPQEEARSPTPPAGSDEDHDAGPAPA